MGCRRYGPETSTNLCQWYGYVGYDCPLNHIRALITEAIESARSSCGLSIFS